MSFKNVAGRVLWQPSINGFGRRFRDAPKGLAMLIRSEMTGIDREAALAARPDAIPAASLPTLLIGLLLLICP
jgi:hypothetical protein